jgi:starch synthase (maltosyl-transferring)
MQHSFVYLPLEQFGIFPHQAYEVSDLVTGERFRWQGEKNYVQLDPNRDRVAHILRLR